MDNSTKAENPINQIASLLSETPEVLQTEAARPEEVKRKEHEDETLDTPDEDPQDVSQLQTEEPEQEIEQVYFNDVLADIDIDIEDAYEMSLKMPNDESITLGDLTEEKSRTKIKQEATELQKLGERLISLTKAQLLCIDIPKELNDAIILSKTINTNKAKRRQKQYIGALMRQIDLEPVLKALKRIEGGLGLTQGATKELKLWQTDLINGEDTPIEIILDKFPEADRQKLRQLIRNARKEKLAAKSQKAAQSLLRYLKEIAS